MESIHHWSVVYLYSLRYILFIASVLFFSKAISVLIDYRTNKAKGALTTVGMCFFTSCYAFSIFLTTFGFTKNYADNMMPFNYITGFFAYYFYTLTIKDYLKITIKYFVYGQYLILITIICHLISFINIIIFHGTPLLSYLPDPPISSGYFTACSLFRVANITGTVVGGVGSIGILLTLIIIFNSLRVDYRDEKLLFWGVIVTGIVSLNDTFLGLGYLKYSFPLYFLGNTLEAIRFSNHFKSASLNIINSLKSHLDRNEKKYHFLAESMKDVIIQLSPEGKLLYVSPSIKKFGGYDAENEIGKYMGKYVGSKADYIRASERLEEIIKTHQTGNFEFLFKPKNSKPFPVELTYFPIVKNNIVTLIQFVLRDITERKQIEDANKKLGIQLQQSQKMESIGTLAGGIAHDFNNILFPIISYSEMLIEDIPDDSPFQTDLNQIHTSALRASELVKQILTFSRQQSGEIKLMKMQPIIKEAVKLIRSSIPKTIEIKQNINPKCGVIKADPTHMHQIVMNLSTNAFHAMEKIGGVLKISLKEIEFEEIEQTNPDMISGDYACLSVADTGTGMDKNLIKKIFDPFFTTKKVGKGTGMGLSVVHGIVKNMGGTINVYSEPEKGTQFHIYLPLVDSVKNQNDHQIKDPIQGGFERILLVDDEDIVATVIKEMLQRLGYKVSSCTSSIEALEVFRINPDRFDMVITDLQMPNIPGNKLAVELIKIRSDIPILLCTGFSETMSEEKATSLGIKGFLLKPIVIKDISRKIREVLDENRVKK